MAHFDWIETARELFRAPRPEHFTRFDHCCECEEHDHTLLAADIDTIGMDKLGSPAWDPLCFATAEGKKYYLPALVRLSLETMADEFYLVQFLFHLQGCGPDNDFYRACDAAQRSFIAAFIASVIERHADEIELNMCSDDALRVYEIWSAG